MPDHLSDLTRTGVPGFRALAGTTPGVIGTVGKYRLIRKLGEGGMGLVFEAEQPDPRRLVALKVMSSGLFVTQESVKLFEREVHALARLKHPNIAAIYEAGVSETGQRFFAMELVSGETLNDFLRTHRLRQRDLLTLFVSICDAVTYAHQRGIIHRDLKPSNMMVQVEHGQPTIKVLDFGIARINDEHDGATTEEGVVRGTLPYMSPEQVGGRPDEIDVRSDVYALGVILYEVLSGRLPLDVGGRGLHEAARIIHEQPPHPLRDAMKGRGPIDSDLCTIVEKALDKDASRRYASVAALSDDIQRYLSDQPIQARPPSTAYQVRKLVSRHRLAFGFSAALLMLLVIFAGAVTVQARRIAKERDRANQESETARQVSSFLTKLFAISNPNAARGNAVTARELLDQGADRIATELKDQPMVRASLLASMGEAYDGLGFYGDARKLATDALELRRGTAGPRSLEAAHSMRVLASITYNQADFKAAIDYDRGALEIYRALLPRTDRRINDALTALGDTLSAAGQYQEALPIAREALDIAQSTQGPDSASTAEASRRLAATLLRMRNHIAAEPLLRDAIRIEEARGEAGIGLLAFTLNDLGNLLSMRGDLTGAEAAYRRCRDTASRIYGPAHPNVSILDGNIAGNLRRQARYAEAETLLRDAMARWNVALGEEHPRYAVFLTELGDIVRDKGDLVAAESTYRRALALDQANATSHLSTSSARLGDVLVRAGRPAEGEPLLRNALAATEKAAPADSPELAEYRRQLGEALTALRRYDEAELLLLGSHDVVNRTFDTHHPESRASAAALAALYSAWGKPDQAAKYQAGAKR